MGFFSHHDSQNFSERSTEARRPRLAITVMAAISFRFNSLRKLQVTSTLSNDPAVDFPEDHQFNRRFHESSEGYVEQ
jgi:hypothetical protein